MWSPHEQVDMVFMFEVLEHLEEPAELVRFIQVYSADVDESPTDVRHISLMWTNLLLT